MLLVGMQTGASAMENNMDFSLKIKNRATNNPAVPLVGINSKEFKLGPLKDTSAFTFITAIFKIAKMWK